MFSGSANSKGIYIYIYIYPSDDDVIVLLLEYISGTALDNFDYNSQMFYAITKNLLNGIKCLHDNNIIHNDIIPIIYWY